MTLEQYLKDRWEKLSPEAKDSLELHHPFNVFFVRDMWEKQYYREQLSHMQTEIDELRRMVKRLYPEK